MYSELCVRLSEKYDLKKLNEDLKAQWQGPEDQFKPITFKRVLLSRCQEEFEKKPRLTEEQLKVRCRI
jgi:hypothetical protein